MKRTIAIVCGGDTSEFEVSLRSAQGIYSFIDKERYTLYIVEMRGTDWHVQLPDGTKTLVDRKDFSFRLDGAKVVFDFAYITIHGNAHAERLQILVAGKLVLRQCGGKYPATGIRDVKHIEIPLQASVFSRSAHCRFLAASSGTVGFR